MQKMPCAVCGEKNTNNFRVYFDGFIKLFKCCNCGFVAAYPGPGESQLIENYEDLNYVNSENDFMYPDRLKGLADICERIVFHKKQGKLLDVGCGDGYLLSIMSKEFECFGVEESKSLSAIAAKKSGSNIFKGKYSKSLFLEKSFDVISFIQVIEHIPQPILALESAYYHLKQNGIIVVEVPSIWSPHFLLYSLTKIKWFVRPPKGIAPWHCCYFSPRSLRKLMKQASFRELKLITGRWKFKYSGIKEKIARIIDPLLSFFKIGGILYIGQKE